MKHIPRKYDRICTVFYLRVFEEKEFIGFLVDFSIDGMMVMSEFPLREGVLYNLRMKLPSTIELENRDGGDNYLHFQAECKWSKQDDLENEFYINGFNFSEISDDGRAILKNMAEQYSSKW